MKPQIQPTQETDLPTLMERMKQLDAKIKRRTPADFIRKIRREGLKNERIWGRAISI